MTIILDKYPRVGIFLACFFVGSGSILIYFAKNDYIYQIAAVVFVSFSLGVVFSGQGTLAQYFSEKTAPIVMCLPLYFQAISSGLAQWYPIYLMDDT